MSMQQMNTPRQVALSQVMVILFAAAFALLPHRYYLLIILLYIVVFPIILSKSGKGPGTKGRIDEIEAGVTLLDEKNAQQIMSRDLQLAEELQAQIKTMTTAFLLMPVVLIFFWLYEKYLFAPVVDLFSSRELGKFVSTFIMFEGSFIISRASMVYASKKTTSQAQMLVMPQKYRVTSRGIVSKSLGSRIAIPFPLKDFKVHMEPKRKFVELVPLDPKKARGKIRLYTKDPYKLYNILQRYVEEKKGGEKEKAG